jgi:hypothetical protein
MCRLVARPHVGQCAAFRLQSREQGGVQLPDRAMLQHQARRGYLCRLLARKILPKDCPANLFTWPQ